MKSVIDQDYKNCELIVVDDGSSDGSVSVIEAFTRKFPSVTFIKLEKNIGICKAFNVAFKICSGDYIIDLAADDILLSNRISRGAEIFGKLDDDYGVIFGDAEWISEDGTLLHLHSARFPHDAVPRGNIYKDLVERYFVCSPTMMFRRTVVEHLIGYDESLTYEDFDFWVRSSRYFKYFYDPVILVKKRKVKNSLSHMQFRILNKHSFSTYLVCAKILDLNRSMEERQALSNRIQYEIKQSIRTLDIPLAAKYALLWIKNNAMQYSS
jgi:glycosyltransferase involved in cell wall biosynthesis